MSAFTKSLYNATESLGNAASATIFDAVSAAGGNWPNWVQDRVSDQSESAEDNKERVVGKEDRMASDMPPAKAPIEDGPTKADSESLQEEGLTLQFLLKRAFPDLDERATAERLFKYWKRFSEMDSEPHPGFDDWVKASIDQWKDKRSGNEGQGAISWEDDFAKHCGLKERQSAKPGPVSWAELQAILSRHDDGTLF